MRMVSVCLSFVLMKPGKSNSHTGPRGMGKVWFSTCSGVFHSVFVHTIVPPENPIMWNYDTSHMGCHGLRKVWTSAPLFHQKIQSCEIMTPAMWALMAWERFGLHLVLLTVMFRSVLYVPWFHQEIQPCEVRTALPRESGVSVTGPCCPAVYSVCLWQDHAAQLSTVCVCDRTMMPSCLQWKPSVKSTLKIKQ